MNRLLKNKEVLITQKYKPSIHEGIDLVGENNTLDYITAHSSGIIVSLQNKYKTTDIIGNSYRKFC